MVCVKVCTIFLSWIPPKRGVKMPKRIRPLSDIQVKNAKPKDKNYKISDGYGLFLLVTSTGGKLWRFQYRYAGKQKLLSFGSYPEISLADARTLRNEARKQVAHGIDAGAVKKAKKASRADSDANSFEVVARQWHDKFKESWSTSHAHVTITRLERDIFPWMGKRPISEIEPPEVLAVLQRIESRGAAETARRMKIVCGQVFRYAVATGRAKRDQTADLKGALKPFLSKHMAALTDPKEVAPLLRAIDDYKGSFVVKCALKLAALFFVRPGELRATEWSEINLETAEWNIPIERMKLPLKTKQERKGQFHLVPLSHQAITILKELQPLTGHGKYVFPSHRTLLRPMSDNAVLSALRRMGFSKDEMSGHGFRAMARTILDEVLQVKPDYIEHQLAHAVRDPNGRAYNRTSYLTERRKMMQMWADFLDGLKTGAVVIPFSAMKS
jgi:integrase